MTAKSTPRVPTATPSPETRAGVPRTAIKIRLHPDVLERTKYWADRENLSFNEYLSMAVEEKIARANGNYDLPALEIQRMNQLVDEMKAMSINMTNLETVTVNGFDSLLGLTRGDSYLQDAEDGELDDEQLSPDGVGEFGAPDASALSDGFGGAM